MKVSVMVGENKNLPKIAKLILDFDANCTFHSILTLKPDHPIFVYVTQNIRIKCLKFPSAVYRLIHRNKSDFEHILTSIACGEVEVQMKILLKIEY